MTRDEAIALVHRGLGFRSDQTQNIIASLVKAQTMLEHGEELPWFIVSEDETLSLSSATQSVDLPANFIREVEDTGLNDFYVQDYSRLVKVDYDVGAAMYATATITSEFPRHYAIREASFYFWPAVSTDTTLVWSYYARQESLLSAAGNVWLDKVPYLLVAMAGKDLASDLRDISATQKFAADEQTWRRSYLNALAARQTANQPMSLGAAL